MGIRSKRAPLLLALPLAACGGATAAPEAGDAEAFGSSSFTTTERKLARVASVSGRQPAKGWRRAEG
jgi:hypothetical protein